MCPPLVAAAAITGIGASIAGTAVSASGQIAAGKAEAAENEANRVLSLAAAREARADAEDELWASGMAGRYSAGTQEALFGGLNVAAGPGTSAGEILELRFQRSVRNSLQIAENASRKSTQLRNSAEVYGARANNVRRASQFAAAGSVLAGVGQTFTFATSAYTGGAFQAFGGPAPPSVA